MKTKFIIRALGVFFIALAYLLYYLKPIPPTLFILGVMIGLWLDMMVRTDRYTL